MKKLDWYILKNLLSTFFFSVFLFTVIAVVIDASEKTDNFVKSKLGFQRIVMDYYAGFVPHIVALLFPLFVFIAVIFFTSKMANRTEIVAILASGVTYNRWLRPYIFGGLILGFLLWLANYFIIPKANQIRGTFEANYVDKDNSYNNLVRNYNTSIYFKVDSFSYAGIMNYDTLTKRGGPFFMHTIEKNKVVKNTRSEYIIWDTTTKKWRLENAFIRNILPSNEDVKQQEKHFIKASFTPQDLSKDKYTKDKLSTPELQRFIHLEQQRGNEGLNELKIELYRRDATCVTVFLLTIIGAIIAGRKVRGGSGSHLAMGFIIAASFIISDRFSTVFSTKGNLSPLIAAWIPNTVFLFIVLYLHKKAPK